MKVENSVKPTKSNPLESENIYKLLVSFCVPALASSLVTSIYNIVDQLFIGNKLGIVGNAATNVVFPVVTLITALSLMCGVGSSAVMNLNLGKGDCGKAKMAVGSGFGLMFWCGLTVTLVLLIWTQPLLNLFGCTETVLPYATEYGRIIAIGFIPSIIGAAGAFLVRADGSPNYALIAVAGGSVLNIGLDAIFVFGLDWGIAGAAWATVISQFLSALMVVLYLPHFKTLEIKISDFKPNLPMYGIISKLGAGPAFNFITQALTQVFLNNALKTYGGMSIYGSETTLAVAGIANKVNMFAVAIITGLTNGMQPIVSYNYGKKNYERVRITAKTVIGTILACGFVIFLCYQFLPAQITALFGEGDALYFEFAAKFFRIYLMLIFLFGLQTSVAGFFSAQGKPWQSILISMTRQLICLPPLLIILPKFFGLNGVLAAGPISDFVMAVIAVILLTKQMKKLAMCK